MFDRSHLEYGSFKGRTDYGGENRIEKHYEQSRSYKHLLKVYASLLMS